MEIAYLVLIVLKRIIPALEGIRDDLEDYIKLRLHQK
jgi:hypothetical protein